MPQALEISCSSKFTEWLSEQNLSLAFTTYQVGKIFFIGLQQEGHLSVFERSFDRAMGLWASGSTLIMSSLYQIWQFENALKTSEVYKGYDCLYVPQISYVTGDLHIHDLALDGDRHLVFVNTLFNCLATVSNKYSFVPLWQPFFISQLVPEDRCHLNGLAMQNGHPRYVTTISQSDMANGWRNNRHDGGCLIDISSNEVVLTGLSMPHSPRWEQNKLWLLNSGSGEFGYVDLKQGKFEPIVFCPGYLRGLTFIDNFAIVGLSKPRYNNAFSGLSLDKRLESENVDSCCGLFVIDLYRGNIAHWLRLEGLVEELYDVVVLDGVRRPMAIGLKTDEIHHMITIGS